jgi:hypothetical protein
MVTFPRVRIVQRAHRGLLHGRQLWTRGQRAKLAERVREWARDAHGGLEACAEEFRGRVQADTGRALSFGAVGAQVRRLAAARKVEVPPALMRRLLDAARVEYAALSLGTADVPGTAEPARPSLPPAAPEVAPARPTRAAAPTARRRNPAPPPSRAARPRTTAVGR